MVTLCIDLEICEGWCRSFSISNAGLGYRNPGSEQIILNIKFRLNEVFITFFTKLLLTPMLFLHLRLRLKTAQDFLLVGIFNYMEDGTPPHSQSQMLNFEIHSGQKMFNLIKPFAGFIYN